jgi:DNA modification methylase
MNGQHFGHIKDLTPDPRNARKHTSRNVGDIVNALHEVGAARSIVIDEDGIVLAGNATLEAAGEAGITKLQVIDADGETVVAVRRTGLTPEQKTRLALFDNRAAEHAQWDTDVLLRLADEGALAGMWTDDELAALKALQAPMDGQTDPDATPDLRATDIQPGDLFQLGKHRLLCGSSTNAEDVARVLAGAVPRLMVTDPQYGVEYDPDWRNQSGLAKTSRTGKVANDDQVDWSPAWALFPGDVAYVWHASWYISETFTTLLTADFKARSLLIWRKPRFAISRGHYHWQHEPCWYAVRNGKTAHWTGDRKQSTVWDIDLKDDTGTTTHGTQKPVECMQRPMRNHDAPEVYEPFSGSGTSLIAAEQLRRACYAIELEPQYVQMAIDRWEAFTGSKAVKAGEAVRP